MMSVKEMRTLAATLNLEQFKKQVGPFALIQRPDRLPDGTDIMGLPPNAATTQMAKAEDISNNSLSLLFEFENLIVAALPPISGSEVLTVGRLPDCELVLDDHSVSKRHATIR